jgi:hypothetical protein
MENRDQAITQEESDRFIESLARDVGDRFADLLMDFKAGRLESPEALEAAIKPHIYSAITTLMANDPRGHS